MTFAKYPVSGSGGGTGDVVGPASSTDNALAVWDGATGKLLKNSSVLVGNVVVGPASATDSAVVLFDGTTGKLIKNSTLSSSTIVQTTGIQSIDGVKTFISSSTVFSGTVTINNSTPLFLGSSPNRVSLVPGTRSVPASWTFPDIGDCTFAALEGTQSFSGSKTFATITLPSSVTYTSNGSIVKSGVGALTLTNASAAGLTFGGTGTVTAPTGTYTLAGLSLGNVFTVAQTVSATTNQIVLGVTNTTTINSTAPAASRTYNIIDAGGAADFVMTAATQTIGGAKTFSSAVTINPASNQLILASGVNQLTLNSSTSAAARTYSFPDVGATGSVAMLEGAQTFSGLKTFSAGVAITGGTAATQRLTVASTTWTIGNGPTITEAGAATFATSVTSPLIVGGSSVSQVLTIKSTTGIGTSDRIDFTVGNNGAVTGLSIGTAGAVTMPISLSVGTSTASVDLSTNSSTIGVARFRNNQADAGARDWVIRTGVSAFGDLGFQVSNAKNGDPVAAGTTAGSITSAGAWVLGPSASTNLNLAVNGRASVTHGLTFPAVQNSSADVNTLDDYEEGTFTPIMTGTTLNGAGTYSFQTGRYTKIGDLVFFTLYVEWSAHTGTGNMRIGQLPFTSKNATGDYVIASILHNNLTHPANSIVIASVPQNASYMDLATFVPGSSARTALAVDAACGFYITGSYLAAT
jgi:hypothetical protein